MTCSALSGEVNRQSRADAEAEFLKLPQARGTSQAQEAQVRLLTHRDLEIRAIRFHHWAVTVETMRGKFGPMSSTQSKVTGHSNGKLATDSDPISVVRQFLDSLVAGDIEGAADLLAVDVDYVNVSTPTIRGRERVRRVLRSMMGLPGAGFEVYLHSISNDGGTVLTERTDVLIWGALRMQFWVCGRFDVQGGEIVLWKDYFDWANFTIAMVRGLVGIIIPAVRAKPPE